MGLRTAVVLGTVQFFLGITFTAWVADHGTLWQAPVTLDSLRSSLTFYRLTLLRILPIPIPAPFAPHPPQSALSQDSFEPLTVLQAFESINQPLFLLLSFILLSGVLALFYAVLRGIGFNFLRRFIHFHRPHPMHPHTPSHSRDPSNTTPSVSGDNSLSCPSASHHLPHTDFGAQWVFEGGALFLFTAACSIWYNNAFPALITLKAYTSSAHYTDQPAPHLLNHSLRTTAASVADDLPIPVITAIRQLASTHIICAIALTGVTALHIGQAWSDHERAMAAAASTTTNGKSHTHSDIARKQQQQRSLGVVSDSEHAHDEYEDEADESEEERNEKTLTS